MSASQSSAKRRTAISTLLTHAMIVVLSVTAIWLGYQTSNTRIILSGVAGLLASFTFATSPRTAILNKQPNHDSR